MMRIMSIGLYVFFSVGPAFGGVPVVKAVGGAGTNVDWPRIQKREDSLSGAGFFYDDCAQGVKPIRASSTLPSHGSKRYSLDNVSDRDPMTAWVEGKKGDGIGEYFEIKSLNVNSIYNGYQATPAIWKNNARVKTFKVYRNNRLLCRLVLKDEMGEQRFELPGKETEFDYSTIYKFEIAEIYHGLKYDDCAISEIDWKLCCFAGNTMIAGSRGHGKWAASLKKEDTILTFDVAKGAVQTTIVAKTTEQVHTRMLKIACGDKEIEATPDHPFYVKGYGFISLERLAEVKGALDVGVLAGAIELLTWDDTSKKTEYLKMTSISMMTGKFATFAILDLENGTTYAANGFITRVYRPSSSTDTLR